jgi:hypothetical protein
MRKAVTSSGQIVGFALWKFYTDVTQNPVANIQDGLDSRETGAENEKEKNKGSEEGNWPEDANVELCEAVFGMSDELCRLAMRGNKYAGKLHFHIVIHRSPQQRLHARTRGTHTFSPVHSMVISFLKTGFMGCSS